MKKTKCPLEGLTSQEIGMLMDKSDSLCQRVCRCYAKDVLPKCVPKPTKLSKMPIYYEEWCAEKRRANDKFVDSFKEKRCPPVYSGFSMKFIVFDWRNIYMDIWEKLNPAPKLGLNDLLHQFHERILKIEAALAEKGGRYG